MFNTYDSVSVKIMNGLLVRNKKNYSYLNTSKQPDGTFSTRQEFFQKIKSMTFKNVMLRIKEDEKEDITKRYDVALELCNEFVFTDKEAYCLAAFLFDLKNLAKEG